MAIPIEMPKLSDTMQEGVVVAWLAEEGQKVSAGDVIAQVETDKATMDLEIYDDGVLLKRVIAEGDPVSIGGLIAVLGTAGEDISAVLAKYAIGGDGAHDSASSASEEPAPSAAAPAPAPTPVEIASPVSEAPTTATPGSGHVKSSPLARRLASDKGIDLAAIRGSGPEGRIIKRDVESFTGFAGGVAPTSASAIVQAATPVVSASYTSLPLSQMRKAIARRLGESKFTAPHFYLTADIAMDKAAQARVQLNELAVRREQKKVSYNDLVTKACALALREHKWVNASYLEKEGEIRFHANIDVAVAVAIDDGLITPVIRNADAKSLGQIAAETTDLATRARNKALQPEEYTGSTFTTSNLGMFGIDEFTAIINPPNACILAIGSVREIPVVEDGQIVVGKRMKVTLSCDHRVVDGASGARFLASVRQYLEDPLSMLL
jgi:pyruvate dehydrogenase E2 component (dihydrolipoamide acetyltransferase)